MCVSICIIIYALDTNAHVCMSIDVHTYIWYPQSPIIILRQGIPWALGGGGVAYIYIYNVHVHVCIYIQMNVYIMYVYMHFMYTCIHIQEIAIL